MKHLKLLAGADSLDGCIVPNSTFSTITVEEVCLRRKPRSNHEAH